MTSELYVARQTKLKVVPATNSYVTLAILTDVLCGFPQFLQTYSVVSIVLK